MFHACEKKLRKWLLQYEFFCTDVIIKCVAEWANVKLWVNKRQSILKHGDYKNVDVSVKNNN